IQRFMMNIEQEQELLMNLADMALTTFAAESALLRLMKCVQQKGANACAWEQQIVSCFLYDAADHMHKYGKDAINAFASGDEQRLLLLGLKRFTKSAPWNGKEGRRAIAQKLLLANQYPL
ncbi:MAG: acyl-CoA dehydrogenase, partial [Chitinophagaceae bacterium]